MHPVQAGSRGWEGRRARDAERRRRHEEQPRKYAHSAQIRPKLQSFTCPSEGGADPRKYCGWRFFSRPSPLALLRLRCGGAARPHAMDGAHVTRADRALLAFLEAPAAVIVTSLSLLAFAMFWMWEKDYLHGPFR